MSNDRLLTQKGLRSCHLCHLGDTVTHHVDGRGPVPADVYLLGEGPGREEDESGQPFVGKSGKLLQSMLEGVGLYTIPLISQAESGAKGSVRIGNVVRCRPPGNRKPLPDEAHTCRLWLDIELAAVRPQVIVCLGETAIRSFLPGFKLTKGLTTGDYVGMAFGLYDLEAGKLEMTIDYPNSFPKSRNDQERYAWLVGCYHPASRLPAQRNRIPAVLESVAWLVGAVVPEREKVDYGSAIYN